MSCDDIRVQQDVARLLFLPQTQLMKSHGLCLLQLSQLFFPLYIYAILPLPQGELHVAHHDFTLPNLPFSADTE